MSVKTDLVLSPRFDPPSYYAFGVLIVSTVLSPFVSFFCCLGAVIASFQNVAPVGSPIEQGGGHFGIAKHGCQFAEAQVLL